MVVKPRQGYFKFVLLVRRFEKVVSVCLFGFIVRSFVCCSNDGPSTARVTVTYSTVGSTNSRLGSSGTTFWGTRIHYLFVCLELTNVLAAKCTCICVCAVKCC